MKLLVRVKKMKNRDTIINKNSVFVKNAIMQYIMIIAQYIFPLLTFPYLTRVLNPSAYGTITYLTATVSYFQIIVDFGFNLSSTKNIAEQQNDVTFISKILGSTIQAKTLLFIFSVVIYTIMIPFVDILKDNILLSYLYMGSVGLSIFLPDFLFRGIEKMEIITIRFIMSKIVTTILTFVLVKSVNDIALIPTLNIVGYIVAILLTWYEIYRLGIHIRYSKFFYVLKVIKESSIYFLSTFATTAFGATNTFMLGVMSLPPTHIAYWGISYNLISSAQSLYTPIINSLYPRMAVGKDFNLVKKILYIFMPAILITVIIVYYFSDLIIDVFCGPGYSESIPVFRFLLPVLIFSFPGMIIGFPVLGVIGKVKDTTISTIFSAVFHIVGLVILVYFNKFTILNVAILRSLTEAVLLFIRIYFLSRAKREGVFYAELRNSKY